MAKPHQPPEPAPPTVRPRTARSCRTRRSTAGVTVGYRPPAGASLHPGEHRRTLASRRAGPAARHQTSYLYGDDVIVWQTGTARLLPRLLEGRKTGPVFLTQRRARLALPGADLDPVSGRARLSYRRTAEIFEQASGGSTLHQLRNSALTHAAEDGANTSTLLAFSGHTSVTSLARYTRVSPEALARWQGARDRARRRR